MNRAIHLSRPDMDVDELFKTGYAISSLSSSCGDQQASVNRNTLKSLAEAYYEYHQSQHIEHFHGLRDYYFLIKYISRIFQQQTVDSYEEIIQKGLLRNFGGLSVAQIEIIAKFCSAVNVKPCIKWTVEDAVIDNLKDMMARHLMLITNGDTGLGILLKSLLKLKLHSVIIFGSLFDEDQTDDYSYRILSRIILCMEEGHVLILKDLENLYGSLYDMLNQNYTIVGSKKNCRIALGPYSNPMCQVHDNFRCIVITDEQHVNYSDPPFLNRFEKQLLRFDDVINQVQKDLIMDLMHWVDEFSTVDKLSFKKEHAFISFNAETIPSLVYQFTQNDENFTRNVFLECKKCLLWLVPPDAILRLSASKLAESRPSEVKELQNLYFDRPVHMGLLPLLQKLVEGKSDVPKQFTQTSGIRAVVFTHTNIHVDFQRSLKGFKGYKILKLGAFKSEKELSKHLREFFESQSSFLLLQCKLSEDGKYIPLAKFLLEELQQVYVVSRGVKQHICLILHVDRYMSAYPSATCHFSFLSGWQLVTVDSIEDPGPYPIYCSNNESLKPLLSYRISELLQTSFRPMKDCVTENLLWAFTQTTSCCGERSIDEFSRLIQQLLGCNDMIDCLSDAILQKITSIELLSDGLTNDKSLIRWHFNVACDQRHLASSTSFIDGLKRYLTECVKAPLATLVYKLEELSAWQSYFVDAPLWKHMFHNTDLFHFEDIVAPRGVGFFTVDRKPLCLQCPFSQCYIDRLCQFEEQFKNEFWKAKLSSENVANTDTLSQLSYAKIFNEFKHLFQENVFSKLPNILSSHKERLFVDILNHFSSRFSLDETDRLKIMTWFWKLKSRYQQSHDALTDITETVLCLWQYEDLYRSILDLFVHCHSVLPCPVDALLSRTGIKTCNLGQGNLLPSNLQCDEASSAEDITDTKAFQLQPEERLVDLLCRCLIPKHSVIKQCGGFHGWHSRTRSVLSFSSSISNYPPALHELRVFGDLAGVLIHTKIGAAKSAYYLQLLAEGINIDDTCESCLDSSKMFALVLSVVTSLNNICPSFEETNAFVSMYIGRCIDLHPQTDVFEEYLLHHLTTYTGDWKYFTCMESVIHRILLETDDLFEAFTYIIRTGDISANQYLQILDEALHKAESNQVIFAVLCTDIVEHVVFKPFNWKKLQTASTMEDDLLVTLKAATSVMASLPHKLSFQTVCAGAYIQQFLSQVVQIIYTDLEHERFAHHTTLYQSLNSALRTSGDDLRNLLLKILKTSKTLHRLKFLLESLKDALPELRHCILPTDATVLNYGRMVVGSSVGLCHDEQLKEALRRVDRNEEVLRKHLKDITELHDIIPFIEILSQITYVTRSVRPMNDSEKQIGVWLKTNGSNFDIFKHQLIQKLVLRLSGEADFELGLLNLKPEATYLQIHQAIVLVHLMTTVIVRKSNGIFKCLYLCLTNPTDTVINNVRTLLNAQLNCHDACFMYNGETAVCENCWTCFYTIPEVNTCRICGRGLPKQTEPVVVYSTESHLFFSKKQLSTNILRLMIDSCIACGISLGVVDVEAVSAILNVRSVADVEANINKLWMNVKNGLHFLDDDYCIFLHYLVDRLELLEDIDFTCNKSIMFSLESIEQLIANKILTSSIYEELKIYRHKVSLFDIHHQKYWLEVIDPDTADPTPYIYRQKKARSLEDIATQLCLTGKESTHELIAQFFNMSSVLPLVRHIMPILKWSLLSRQLVSYKFSRKECQEMLVERLLKTDKSGRSAKCFDEFEASWKELRANENSSQLSRFENTLSTLPVINKRVFAHIVVVDSKESVIYKVLRSLTFIQNAFLNGLLHIALNGKCPSLAFLERYVPGDDVPLCTAVKCALLQNVKETEIISVSMSDMEANLLCFTQNDLKYGCGNNILCNFVKIEMELANNLALGKTHLVMNDSFPLAIYSGELFVSSASIIQKIHDHIPQAPVSHHIISGIQEKRKDNPDYVQKMMQQTEVLLSLIVKAGNTTDQTVDSYVQTWKGLLPGEFAVHLLPTGREPLRLSHLVGLYEYLECLQADFVIATLSDNLKVPLNETLRREFLDYVRNNNIPAELLETAIKRFIIRYLIYFEIDQIDLEQPLQFWIVEPSLWGARDSQECSVVTEEDIEIAKRHFPQSLNLNHAHNVLHIIREIILEKQTNMASRTAAEFAAAKSMYGKRSRGKGRLGNT